MPPRPSLPVAVAALCAGVVVVTAAALEPSLPMPPVQPPPATDQGATGPSLFALLLQFLFGEFTLGALGGGPDVRGLFVTLAVAGVVVVLAAVVAVILLIRERLSSGTGAFEHATTESGSGDEPRSGWPGRHPTHVVDRAWLALVASLPADPSRTQTLTTGEVARRAVERGDEPEAVRSLTGAFERVHYAGDDPAEQAERARQSERALGLMSERANQRDTDAGDES